MARHAVNAEKAFEMLRDHSQHNGHKLVEVAQAIVDSHLTAAAATAPADAFGAAWLAWGLFRSRA